MKSAPPIAFDYRPSRRVAAVALVLVVIALSCAFANDLPIAPRIGLALAVLAVAAWGLVRFLRPPFARVAWGASGWSLTDRYGRVHAADLIGQRRLGGLVALDFRCAGQRSFSPLLAGDNLDSDTRRRLVLTLARAGIAPPA